jgi:glutamyl-tRNA reductase
MVDAELEQWAQWLATRDLEHVIKSLYADSDRLTRETARELSLADPAQTEPVLRRAVRRMLHEHVTRLRAHTTVNPGG